MQEAHTERKWSGTDGDFVPQREIASFDPNLLHRLTIESTLAELPYWELSLPDNAPGLQAAHLFQKHPKLPGILIFGEDGYLDTVSRERFYTLVGRPFGSDLFNKRPIRFMLEQSGRTGYVLDHLTPIQKAAEVCLRRQGDSAYEALVVSFPDRPPRLIDFRDLLVAQTCLLTLAKNAKEQFLSTMSHELKTPLTSMLLYAELLREEAETFPDPQALSWVGKIESNGKNLLHLINSVLDLSKIDAGRMELELQTVDVLQLIREVEETILPLAARNRNRFLVIAPSKMEAIRSDPVKVSQILLNLLGNACKFTQDGEVSMKIEETEDRVVFTVSDTGIGMTPEQIEKIFHPFIQGDSSITRRYGGTGLGLSIAHHFCQLMGGEVTLQSQPGLSTTFTVRLPKRTDAPPSPHQMAPSK